MTYMVVSWETKNGMADYAAIDLGNDEEMDVWAALYEIDSELYDMVGENAVVDVTDECPRYAWEVTNADELRNAMED